MYKSAAPKWKEKAIKLEAKRRIGTPMSTATLYDSLYIASCLFKEQVETGKFCSSSNYWLERKNEKSTILTYSYQSGNYVVSADQPSHEKVFLQSLDCTPNLAAINEIPKHGQCFTGSSLLCHRIKFSMRCCLQVLLHFSAQTCQRKRTTEAEEHSSRQQLHHSLVLLFTQFTVLKVAEHHRAHIKKTRCLFCLNQKVNQSDEW